MIPTRGDARSIANGIWTLAGWPFSGCFARTVLQLQTLRFDAMRGRESPLGPRRDKLIWIWCSLPKRASKAWPNNAVELRRVQLLASDKLVSNSLRCMHRCDDPRLCGRSRSAEQRTEWGFHGRTESPYGLLQCDLAGRNFTGVTSHVVPVMLQSRAQQAKVDKNGQIKATSFKFPHFGEK